MTPRNRHLLGAHVSWSTPTVQAAAVELDLDIAGKTYSGLMPILANGKLVFGTGDLR